MQIPNVDGRYKNSDGSIKVIVTRSVITVDTAKPKQEEYTIVDDERQPPRRRGGTGESPLRKMGKGFTDLSYMLIGE